MNNLTLTENQTIAIPILRSQIATLRLDKAWGTHRKYLSFVCISSFDMIGRVN